MIKITRLNDSQLYINAEMIVFVEETPDTVITLNNEKKMVVRENPEEIVKRIMDYKQRTMKLITIKKGETE